MNNINHKIAELTEEHFHLKQSISHIEHGIELYSGFFDRKRRKELQTEKEEFQVQIQIVEDAIDKEVRNRIQLEEG